MNWLKALSGRDTKVQAQMLPKTTYQSLRGNKVEINKQLKRAAPLYFIIDKISRETSRSTFILNEAKYRGKKFEEIGRTNGFNWNNDDRMELLINPNIYMDNIMFNKLLATYWHTNGAMVILKDRGKDLSIAKGKVKNLFPINPTWIQKLPTQGNDFYQIVFNNELLLTVHKDNVIMYRNADVEKPYSDFFGSVQSITDEIAIIEKSSIQIASYFQNNMTPDSVVAIEGMPEAQAKTVEEKWKDKFLGVFKRKIPLFTGGKITYTKLQSEFKDIELKDLRKEEREDIERKYNVVYNLDKANRNTALIVKQEFYDNQIIPLLDIIKSIWNNHILKEIDRNLYLDYVDPTPKDTELLLQMLQQNPHMATKGRIAEIMGIELEEWEDETEICLPSSMVRISLKDNKVITEIQENKTEETLKVSEKKRLFGLNFKAK